MPNTLGTIFGCDWLLRVKIRTLSNWVRRSIFTICAILDLRSLTISAMIKINHRAPLRQRKSKLCSWNDCLDCREIWAKTKTWATSFCPGQICQGSFLNLYFFTLGWTFVRPVHPGVVRRSQPRRGHVDAGQDGRLLLGLHRLGRRRQRHATRRRRRDGDLADVKHRDALHRRGGTLGQRTVQICWWGFQVSKIVGLNNLAQPNVNITLNGSNYPELKIGCNVAEKLYFPWWRMQQANIGGQ